MSIARNVLRKYTLPISERCYVLQMLKDKGIDLSNREAKIWLNPCMKILCVLCILCGYNK
jgi:hypothetical protein